MTMMSTLGIVLLAGSAMVRALLQYNRGNIWRQNLFLHGGSDREEGVRELANTEGNKVLDYLSSLNVYSQTFAHAPVYTVDEQSDEIASVIDGQMTKNLFLKDKKHGLFLVTASHDTKVNIKTLQKLLGLKGAKMSFAKEALLEEVLGVSKGSVTALAMINDTERKVRFIIDKKLVDKDQDQPICCHPLRNDRTTAVSASVLKTFMDSLGVEMTVVDFESTPDDAPLSSPEAGATILLATFMNEEPSLPLGGVVNGDKSGVIGKHYDYGGTVAIESSPLYPFLDLLRAKSSSIIEGSQAQEGSGGDGGRVVLLIDGDNTRGKSGFRLSKEDLLHGVARML